MLKNSFVKNIKNDIYLSDDEIFSISRNGEVVDNNFFADGYSTFKLEKTSNLSGWVYTV